MTPTETIVSLDQWLLTWAQFDAVDPAQLPQVHEQLVQSYSESHRHYHTLHHIAECLARLGSVREHTIEFAELQLAIWFHDSIYDTRRKDNEHQSALWLTTTAEVAGLSVERRNRLVELVMATSHLATPSSPDSQILVDVDLSILGASRPRFQEYELQVRREYDWVPEQLFRQSRAKILRQFLGRPRIFSTSHFIDAFEDDARSNLQWSLTNLT